MTIRSTSCSEISSLFGHISPSCATTHAPQSAARLPRGRHFEIGRNARGTEGMTADCGSNTGQHRTSANHAVDIGLRHGLVTELSRLSGHRAEQGRLRLLFQVGRFQVLRQVLV